MSRPQVSTRTVGSIVRDRDDPGDYAVVVNVPGAVANEWYVQGRGTVARDNPDYPQDDAVVVVCFVQELARTYPFYSGVKPLPLSDLSKKGVAYYTFPSERLEAVGRYGPHHVPIERVYPAPYHSRTFRYDENSEFIATIRDRGCVPQPLLARPVDGRFELINGHKRAWAAAVAGLDRVAVIGLYTTEEDAARAFAKRHLAGYTPSERASALGELPQDVAAEYAPLEECGSA